MSPPSILDRLRIVLVRTRNPLNLGAVARCMSNFGFLKLRVVEPYEPAFREARSAVGGASVLAAAKEFPTLAAAIADCSYVVGSTAVRHRVPKQPVFALPEASDQIHRQLQSGNVALLFGNEKSGLSNDDFSHCHALLHIPTRDKNPSMNLGQAVAVCLYELCRESDPHRLLQTPRMKTRKSSRGGGKTEDMTTVPRAATASDLERLANSLTDALRLSGYIKPGSDRLVEENLRAMLRRQHMNTSDAQTWLGMLRKILWKLRSEV